MFLFLTNRGDFLMIYGYIRVSTVKQASEGSSLEAQENLLSESGVLNENIYKDIYTGTRSSGPEFNKLLDTLKKVIHWL
jgi:DNA invertase Pin-like site-specific DNA recombinase